jgi:hypothetical protein
MPTIIIKQEVEPTPELIAGILSKYASKLAGKKFPYPSKTFIEIKPEFANQLQAAPGMPALVLMMGQGSPLGCVAFHKIDGDISVAFLSEAQVAGEFKFSEPEVPAST